MNATDRSGEIAARVRTAAEQATPLRIVGGASKGFYGRTSQGEPLSVLGHEGVIDYEPSELVMTARAGTPLQTVQDILAERGQMLAFEPPHFGAGATLGGAVACGLSGPRRPYTGAVRDFVLGVKIVNGGGETLTFGGRVMKNVAGYDLSRLMAGALGTLGVLLDISLKVLPTPRAEMTVWREATVEQALDWFNAWAGQPLPLSAAAFDGARLYVRLSGTEQGIRQGHRRIGGDTLSDADAFWASIREQHHGFFDDTRPLWRLSVPPTAPPLDIDGRWFIDWGGAQRWLLTDAPVAQVRSATARAGGHATLFRRGDPAGAVFHELPPALAALQQRVKSAMDPAGILNPGRLYPDW
ncbi:MAG: glycolate oxidase subunit GlcE [Gammaproteobacteria bacterium]